ncbi:hypothetical protein HMN09_00450200 [Mycena chlorophos]|uniref:Adenylate kinase n=1 Tax=Mycena chlorophos TaxID=658473 RepID=A0A8H6TK32_MYCCL|nr:hypothetical protein HMN09_00450200 [Mycena chlorophos]
MSFPPLLGDGKGVYRVHLVGNGGVGKSTVGRELAKLLGVPFISLDEIFWKPNWERETAEGMRAKVAQALAAAPNGWVVDGNYGKRLGGLVEDPSTDVIWLDPPLLLYIPRIIVRTFARLLGLAPPCREGCNETLSTFFSRENIVLWSIQNHGVARRREGARFEKIGLGVGTDVEGRKMRRIGGWGSELTAWMESVRAMIRSQ